MTRGPDYELEALLSLDGYEFRFTMGYVMKLEARQVKPGRGRPHGVKYSLTLHNPEGHRIYGIDNAHRTGPRREFDPGICTERTRSCAMPIADRWLC